MADSSLTNTGKGLGIVLVERNQAFDPVAISEAGARLGIDIVSTAPESLRVDNTIDVAISLMPNPHPEALDMTRSPTSAKPETLERMTGFFVLAAFGLPENDQVAADWYLSRIVASVVRGTPSLAAMLGQGMFFYEADFFARMVENKPSRLASQIAVDLTIAREDDDRLSVVTHGLNRYGYEELFVITAEHGSAILHTMALAGDILDGTVRLSAGGTVPGAHGAAVVADRVPSPVSGRPDVLRLDEALRAPKRGFFNRRR